MVQPVKTFREQMDDQLAAWWAENNRRENIADLLLIEHGFITASEI
jgi:hypothetical protein